MISLVYGSFNQFLRRHSSVQTCRPRRNLGGAVPRAPARQLHHRQPPQNPSRFSQRAQRVPLCAEVGGAVGDCRRPHERRADLGGPPVVVRDCIERIAVVVLACDAHRLINGDRYNRWSVATSDAPYGLLDLWKSAAVNRDILPANVAAAIAEEKQQWRGQIIERGRPALRIR